MIGPHEDSTRPTWRRRLKGQSLVELALAMPVLLILLSGLLEFGFALNQYLNALDAAREGARYAADGDPTLRDATNTDCNSTSDYYILAECVAGLTMQPVPLDPARDDIVISIFKVLKGNIVGRLPSCQPSDPITDCPNDPPTF